MLKKKQVLEEFKQRSAIKSALKQILLEDFEKIQKNILKDYGELLDFIEAVKENPELVKKYIPLKYQEKLKKITEKKKKFVELRYDIRIQCLEEDGIKRIKNVFLNSDSNVRVYYISAGKYHLKYSAENFKQGKQDISSYLSLIQERAKK